MFNFHQWTVAKKMVLTGAVLLVMLVAICSLAVLSLSRAQRNFDNFVSDDFSRGGLARDVRAATSARAISARNLILLNGPEDVKAETIAVKAAHDRVQERLGMLKSAVEKSKDVTPQERELLSRIVALESQYGPVALDIVAMALAGDKQGATEKMNAECQPLLKKLIATTTDYSRLITASGAAEIKRSTEEFMAQRLLLTSSSVAAILIAAGLGVLIHKSLARSLGADPIALRAAAKRVASGDLGLVPGSATAPSDSVLASLGDMQASLAGIVAKVRASATSIETGSQEIAAGNADLALRTEQQAGNLQRSASSMEEMTANVNTNSDTAAQARQLAQSARAAAENGGALVGQVVATMDEISSSSRRISDIIGVIDGIAFQTNILALNAAVEAARAGEQGRGFAVVANEVRTLAHRSAQAAKEIKGLIETSVGKVQAGSGLVNSAGLAMTDIVQEVNRVADLIREISDATQDQAKGINHISGSVAQLDQATQQNAALVEQMAGAAGALNQQAQGLVHSVAVFRLAEQGSPGPSLAIA